MRFQDVYSLDEAASRLGVSPRRLAQLLSSGQIAGERLGRRWLVPAAEVERGSINVIPVGRPFGARLSWAILAELEGLPSLTGLAREERARLRRHVARPFAELAPALRGRAERRPLILSANALEEVIVSNDYVVGGARALRLVGSARAPAVDIYLPTEHFEELLDRTLAVPDATFPNLVAHVVDASYWPFGPRGSQSYAWVSASVLDLYEAGSLPASGLNAVRERLLEGPAGGRRVSAP